MYNSLLMSEYPSVFSYSRIFVEFMIPNLPMILSLNTVRGRLKYHKPWPLSFSLPQTVWTPNLQVNQSLDLYVQYHTGFSKDNKTKI